MNRSKIDWCDHTWNPITGCLHGCPYCYARKMTARFSGDIRLNKMAKENYQTLKSADGEHDLYILNEPMKNETGHDLVYPFGFEPTFHRYRLNTLDKLKMGKNIFVGAMADMFGEWVPDEWITDVISNCICHPQHNYLFLTKNPERYIQYGMPIGFDNMWYGISVTKEADINRLNYLPEGHKTFVNIEPLLEELKAQDYGNMFESAVDWLIIGAQTGRQKNRITPKQEWIKNIVLMADTAGIPVFMKDSLIPIVGKENMRREFPKELQRKELSEKMERKLFDICCDCGDYQKKSEMITLLARSQRGEQPKQYAFMCETCFKKTCENYGIEIPKLKKLEEEKHG